MPRNSHVAKMLGATMSLSFVLLLVPVALSDDLKNCDMTYSLKGWSAVYKTAHGEGKVTCKNGETADVSIKVKGGGITFGKTEIYNGKAEISHVHSINDIFGSYAAASAHAGVAKAGEVMVMTKGEVSLALAGSGEGVDVGIDFSKFTISKPGADKDDHDEHDKK